MQAPGVPDHRHCSLLPAPLDALLITCSRLRFCFQIQRKILKDCLNYSSTEFMDVHNHRKVVILLKNSPSGFFQLT